MNENLNYFYTEIQKTMFSLRRNKSAKTKKSLIKIVKGNIKHFRNALDDSTEPGYINYLNEIESELVDIEKEFSDNERD